ncbi:MAG: hypothetical protein LC623_04810, partial [Halobacteriales archaeon]|nr:hypothetical protein [Halobacteriales archaeon]
MPTGREGAAGSFIGPLFFVSHGFSPFIGDSTNMEVYNPLLDTWTALAPAVVPRSELVGETALGLHYAIGGRSNVGCSPTFVAGAVCDTVEIYNPALNLWTAGAPMPNPRAGAGAAEVNGLIYIIGGRDCGTPYCGTPANAWNDLQIYNPVTNTWAIGPPMPTARMDVYSVTHLGDLIYVAGGYDGVAELATVEIFDTATSVWLPGVAMPTARSNAVAGVCEGHIYVIGGTISGGINVATVEEYDPATATWTAAPSLPAPASELASSHVSGANAIGLPLVMATGSGI